MITKEKIMEAAGILTEKGKREKESIEGGEIYSKSITELPAGPSRGSMMAAQFTDGTWALFFEMGADWSAFSDDERHNEEWVEKWMPKEIRLAVKELIKINRKTKQDMQWYLDWADDAEETLKNK